MSITKTVRFEVFKRDNFRCQYCGKTPPEVTLEVDHIQPRSKKGSDDINNLVTSCFDCNRGKRDIVLEKVPNTVALNLEILKEKEVQLREYNRFVQKIEKRLQSEFDEVNAVFASFYKDRYLKDSFRNVTLRRFLGALPKSEVIQAMYKACQLMIAKHGHNSWDDAANYFCGICWKKIRGI
jgi:CRISPR/Cas system Type II protein with McrA/HNH and RuvC-like nuclease domain